MGRSVRDYRAALASGRWFAALPGPLQDQLIEAGRLRRLGAGELLFGRGDEPGGLFAVLDGSVRISATGPDGKETLLIVLEPPSWFGEISLFDGLPMTHDAVTGVDTLVVEIARSRMLAIAEAEPTTWRELGVLMAGKTRLAFLAMEDRALLPNRVRMARRLVWMAEGYGQLHGRSHRLVEVRQEELAQMLSVSRQTANQLLKELEGQGLIRTTYGEIEIVDLAGLRAAAGFDQA